MIRCARCGKRFRGLTGFDAHRVGRFVDVHPDYGRRCLTDDELRAKGFEEKTGGWVTESGYWAEGGFLNAPVSPQEGD